MKLKSLDREVGILTETRKMAREVQEMLMEWIMVDPGDTTNMQFPAINSTRAEEKRVQLLFGLSQDELDNLSPDDYEALKQAIFDNEKKSKSNKKKS